jgi:hypothetical protein
LRPSAGALADAGLEVLGGQDVIVVQLEVVARWAKQVD